MTAGEHLERVEVPCVDALHACLAEHHDQQAGGPARHPRGGFGRARRVRLDGRHRRRLDEDRTRQLVSPRRTRPWAKSYADRAERLLAENRLHPAGLAAVEQATATDMGDAMNDVDALLVPADLAEALDANPPAAGHVHAFPPSVRRSILRWIASARTPGTRTQRIDRTVSDAGRNVQVKIDG